MTWKVESWSIASGVWPHVSSEGGMILKCASGTLSNKVNWDGGFNDLFPLGALFAFVFIGIVAMLLFLLVELGFVRGWFWLIVVGFVCGFEPYLLCVGTCVVVL